MAKISLALLVLFLPTAAMSATMPAVSMKVFDAESGKPIAGANVVFQCNARAGTFTGHGGKTKNLFLVETVTNDSGEINFPEQKFSGHPFFLNTNYENPHMMIFKTGYVAASIFNQSHIIPTLKEIQTWERNHETVQLKKPTNDGEYRNSLQALMTYTQAPFFASDSCVWQKMPKFLVALHEASYSAKPIIDRMDPLQVILMNDAAFVANGCPSPRAFFGAPLKVPADPPPAKRVGD